MRERRGNISLAKNLMTTAQKWEIPLELESSLMPSAGGFAPAKIPVVCGIGPVARDLYAPQEAINRISLIQRTLLIAEFLAQTLPFNELSAEQLERAVSALQIRYHAHGESFDSSTEPMGMPPSDRPFLASSIAAARNAA
mgnify:CR=1 FL=1